MIKKKVEMYYHAVMYITKTVIIVTLHSYSGLNLSPFVTYFNIKIES